METMNTQTKTTSENKLLNHVQYLADEISKGFNAEWVKDFKEYNKEEEPTAYDYLNDALSIDYIIASDGTFKGAEVLVAFGGPNITINTRNKCVEGCWWGDSAKAYYDDNLGLEECLEELYECGRA
tara:strand:+ start:1448 stop:1825 length:378 start_codon:yes stop_codon:yes gene_type:complete